MSAVQDNGKCGEVINFPSINNGENFGYINIGNGSIYILNEKKMYLFNFDQNPAIEIPGLTLEWERSPLQHGGIWSAMATTKNGLAYFVYKKEVFVFKNGNWKKMKNTQTQFEASCATFIPDNDNDVYISGGRDKRAQDKVFRYSFDQDDYEEITELPQNVRSHACTGYVESGLEYLVVAGGADPKTDKMHIYSISEGTWGESLFLPGEITDFNMMVHNGYFYFAGGIWGGNANQVNKIVWKRKIGPDGDWEMVMEAPCGLNTWVVPFNIE